MRHDEQRRYRKTEETSCDRPSRLDSDAELIAACLKGDAPAWNALIVRYQGFIFRLALRQGLSTPDAEDVFQNVCVKLYQHLGELRDVHRLSGWLASVTQRETAQLFRKQPLSLLHEGEVSPGLIEGAEPIHSLPALTPEEELLALERQHLVRQTLTHLPEECRHLLTLLYDSDPPRSYAEVAASLTIPLGSIGPKRARCLERLRKELEKFGY